MHYFALYLLETILGQALRNNNVVRNSISKVNAKIIFKIFVRAKKLLKWIKKDRNVYFSCNFKEIEPFNNFIEDVF